MCDFYSQFPTVSVTYVRLSLRPQMSVLRVLSLSPEIDGMLTTSYARHPCSARLPHECAIVRQRSMNCFGTWRRWSYKRMGLGGVYRRMPWTLPELLTSGSDLITRPFVKPDFLAYLLIAQPLSTPMAAVRVYRFSIERLLRNSRDSVLRTLSHEAGWQDVRSRRWHSAKLRGIHSLQEAMFSLLPSKNCRVEHGFHMGEVDKRLLHLDQISLYVLQALFSVCQFSAIRGEGR
jgi:hypothetical protein